MSDIITEDKFLDLQCMKELPETDFAMHKNLPIEKDSPEEFPLTSAMSKF